MTTNSHHDWMPSKYEELRDVSTKTVAYLEKYMSALGIDGKTATWIKEEFFPKQQRLVVAVDAWIDVEERTPMKIEAVKEAKAEFAAVYRKLFNYVKGIPSISNLDLMSMGFPAISHDKPTPVPAPASYPDLTVESNGIRRVKVTFRDHGAKKTGKPFGVGGAVVRWAILPAPPKNINELINSALDTKSPFLLSFEEDLRGKTLYVAAAWQNTRGEKGDWSKIESTIIL